MSKIQTITLSGHKGPVTCLANNSHGTINTTNTNTNTNNNTKNSGSSTCNDSPFLKPVLLSGSEDGTVRLWDLKANCKRAALCIKCPFQETVEVTAISLHSSKDVTNNHATKYPYTIFASWAGKVYAYDIRNVSSPIVSYQDNDMDNMDYMDSTTTVKEESPFYPIPQLQGEEINQLALYYNHRRNVQYLATADDDGSCRILHPVPLTQPPHRTDQNNATPSPSHYSIQHASSSSSDAALVTSIAFRPRTKPDQVELVTSGTDCTICSWDVTLKKKVNAKLKSRYSISKLQSDENVNQVCNPPLVHSICWSPSGRLLSAGLGDGSILILRPEGRRLVEVSRITSTQFRMGHSSAVASVLFPQLGGNIPNSTSHVTTEDRFMVTGGNDGNIIFWDLGSFVGGDYAMDPRLYIDCRDGKSSSLLPLSSSLSSVSHPLESDMNQLSLATSSLDPNVLFALNHKKKPNCLLSTHASDAVFADSIIVGDTSNDITIYTLPRI